MKYTWKVGGITKHYGKMQTISDTVETSRLDSSLAQRKARTKYPKANELSVTRVLTSRDTKPDKEKDDDDT